MMELRFVILFAVMLLIPFASSGKSSKNDTSTLDKITKERNYDTSVRPAGTPGGPNATSPVNVKVNIFLRSISEIDDVNMQYSVQMTFRENWKDSRLDYKGISEEKHLILTDAERIWRPDAFFSNEKSGHFHNIIRPNVLIRINPDGSILYSTRISLKLSCPMDMRYYPMDVQECEIRIASYAYTTEDIRFAWEAKNPVQVTKPLHLPRFSLKSYMTDTCTSNTTTGEYSCLKVVMKLSRQFSYYLFQVYLPSIVLVMISWVTFWLDQRATAARFAIWVTVLLTLAIKMAGINAKLPAVSYTKAIDVWTGTCLMFVFLVLFELAWVMQCVTAEDKANLDEDTSADDSVIKKHSDHGNEVRQPSESKSAMGIFREFIKKYPARSQKIDAFCRVIFPLVFAFFNLVYWSTYSQSINMEGTRYS